MRTATKKPCPTHDPAAEKPAQVILRRRKGTNITNRTQHLLDERQRREFARTFEERFQPAVWACLNTNRPMKKEAYSRFIQKYLNIIARETKQDIFLEGVYDYNPTNPNGFINGHHYLRFDKYDLSPLYIADTWVHYLKQQAGRKGGKFEIIDWASIVGSDRDATASVRGLDDSHNKPLLGEQEEIKKAEAYVVKYDSERGPDGFNATKTYGVEQHKEYLMVVGCHRRGKCRQRCTHRK